MLHSLTAASPLVLAASPAVASAQAVLEARAAEAVEAMRGKKAADAVFAPVFLAAVPPAQLTALAGQLEAAHGEIQGIEDLRAESANTIRFTIRFARATAIARLTIEAGAPNKVIGFRIGPALPLDDGIARIAADFAALPGRAGFAVVALGDKPSVIQGARADEQFAIGSAFKFWVLDALAEEIAAKRHRWDEVVPLGPRSLPSGLTQDWPAGTPVTIETLAILMISRSDNTATDTLIRLIGRDRISARVRATGHSAPSRMAPFLTTAEAFALKLSDPGKREAYARADDAAQAKMLAALDAPAALATTDAAALAGRSVAVDSIEWFASPADLARVLDALRRRDDPRLLPILAVAPGLPADLRERFAYVGYKGGSEPGVIDLTWLLRDKAGAWSVVTASWNDAEGPVDEGRFQELALRLIRLVR